jgi:hypothetical protein
MDAEPRRQGFNAVVRPKVGVGGIRFGATSEDIITALGAPEKSWVDEEGDRLLAYPGLGIAFFAFDPEEDLRLVTCELQPASDVELWGLRVFQTPRELLIRAAAAQGLRLQQRSPDARDDEALFQIRSEGLDFYYEDARLVTLSASVVYSADDSIQWPRPPYTNDAG